MQVIQTFTISAALFASWVAAQNGLTANTPGSLFECQPGLLTWTGGVAPYFPRINQAGSTTQTLEQLPQTNSNSYTWQVNLAQGTTFTFAVSDSTGAQAFSGISPAIGPGNNSCLNATATSVVGGGSSTGSQTSPTTSSSMMGGSTGGTTPTTRPTTSSTSTGGSTPTSSASSGNGAAKIQGAAAIAAGAIGVVVAALI